MSIMQQFMMASVLMMGILVEAQLDAPACTSQLPPCLEYINSTKPPNFCCDPIKHLYATQQNCLCQFVFTAGSLEGFGITTTQAIKFGHSCGVDVSITKCKAALSAPSPSSPAQPPPIPGSDEGGAGRVASNGLSFVLLLWASILFN